MKWKILLAVILVLAVALAAFPQTRRLVARAVRPARPQKSMAQRVEEFGGAVRARLLPRFKQIGVAYPPRRIVLAAFKSERILEVWVAGDEGRFRLLQTYPILAASGALGPKLREGDRQVPEGLYRIESLNPNSLYHLALRVNYPNAYDRDKAAGEKRANLGGDIMIHGRACSIGCLAMGDPAAEDLFVLAAETGLSNIEVVISPVDFRKTAMKAKPGQAPPWYYELCGRIRRRLLELPAGP